MQNLLKNGLTQENGVRYMKKLLFDNEKIFILAEIAQSYEGEINVLLDIIDGLSVAKTNGIMFQVVYADELVVPDNDYYDLFAKLEMENNDWKKVIEKIQAQKIFAVAEIFGKKSFNTMMEYGIDAVKIHASDLTNEPFLKYIGNYNIPVLLAVGGGKENEIKKAISLLNKKNKEIVLMHGYQKGPTPISDTHFFKIPSLMEKFSLPVGYSDHIAGFKNSDYSIVNDIAIHFPLISIGAGARLIEKHVILDRSKKWEDYESALTTAEFIDFVKLVRETQNSMGSKSISCNETEENYRVAIKSIVAKKEIESGVILTEDHIVFKRVNQNINSIKNINDVIGYKTKKSIKINDPITNEKLEKKINEKN